MTNEEAKLFLDNLKICIDEHPIVADWLVEIADRKTEPLTCDGNCWMKKQNGEWLCEHCQRKPKTEPNCLEKPNNSTISKMEQVEKPQTCSVNGRPYDCGNCEYFRCTADEPQTERSE